MAEPPSRRVGLAGIGDAGPRPARAGEHPALDACLAALPEALHGAVWVAREAAALAEVEGMAFLAHGGTTAAALRALIAAAEASPAAIALLDAPPGTGREGLAMLAAMLASDRAALLAPQLLAGEAAIPASAPVAGRLLAAGDGWIDPDLTPGLMPASAFTDADREALSAAGVNVVRARPDGRLRLTGLRTLSTQAELRDLPVLALRLRLAAVLTARLDWTGFSQNDASLWQQVRAEAEAALLPLWRAGALQGARPQDAFAVRCGADTTTRAEQSRGLLRLEVRIAPLRPAEFQTLTIPLGTATRY